MAVSNSVLLDARPGRTAGKPLHAFLDQAVREYRDKLMERILRKEVRKPWMKYREIGIMEDLLRALKPQRALEWGAGYGTSHFSRLLPPGGEWLAVEHDVDWAERIRQDAPPNVRVSAVPPEKNSWAPGDGDGSYGDFREYVEYPARFGDYDFILVDGRARDACLRQARYLLAPGGVVVLHDANRDFLRKPLELYPRQIFFQDYRRYAGGIWIGSVDRDISSLVDLGRHRRIWGFYNALGRRFRL
ncbi:MAG: Radical domain protein [Fibrobacteres bacterium]|nr:Radical domain protein [Fibrobacterota bacterium]